MPPKASAPSGGAKAQPKASSVNSRKTIKAGQDKLSADERKIFEACSGHGDGLLNELLGRVVPDGATRLAAVNTLLGRGMLRVAHWPDGRQVFHSVTKEEQQIRSGMAPDEKLIFECITNAGNSGMWTRTLKTRTNIHQTNVNRCLKSLEGKDLIKCVKSVKFPTRKIYMLSALQPSIELSGGPWYTDNELDTEFIRFLMQAIRKCLQERSTPDQPSHRSPPFWPVSQTKYLATTASDVLAYLRGSGIMQAGTELAVHHIRSLLDVMTYDGEVERIAIGGPDGHPSGSVSDSSDETPRRPKRQRTGQQQPRKLAKARRDVRGASPDSDDIDADRSAKDVVPARDDGESDESDNGEEQATPMPSSAPLVRAQSSHVYRYTRAAANTETATRISGSHDMPCGRCPQVAFCAEKGSPWSGASDGRAAPVNPVDCVYFTHWLDF